MPRGKVQCPICLGAGIVTENTEVYEFVTRDPITSRCLICDGSGYIGNGKILPNGEPARSAIRKAGKRLNVNKKSMVSAPPSPLNPRLSKVLASGKRFLIITETEPYYLRAYRMIRNQEKEQGTWSADDEKSYVSALENKIFKKGVSNG